LISHEVIINLIASTRTKSGLRVQCELDINKYPKGLKVTDPGLRVQCELDINKYPKGLKVTDQEMKKLQIAPHEFYGEWNYTLSPRT